LPHNELTKVVQLGLTTVCSMACLSLNNLSTIKMVANHVLMGFSNIKLVHNNKKILVAHGVVI
jgi:hypothetical protein